MGDLTRNISQHELECKCGDPECNVTIDKREPIILMVQNVGDEILKKKRGKKLTIIITSGARCFVYNRLPVDEGGAGSNDDSRHPRCAAIDFKILIDGVQVSTQEVHDHMTFKWPHNFGMGLYETFNHLDYRPWRARWVG